MKYPFCITPRPGNNGAADSFRLDYRDPPVSDLLNLTHCPNRTSDKSVRDRFVREFATLGIMRALLDGDYQYERDEAHLSSLNWTTELLIAAKLAKESPKLPEQTLAHLCKLRAPNGHLDPTTNAATLANRPNKLAEIICDLTTAPGLVIALGHGGIQVAYDTALALREITSEPIDIFPVRFSGHKKLDLAPFVDSTERNYLKDISQGRTAVVIDDDACSGLTISSMLLFLKDEGIQTPMGVTPVRSGEDITGEFNPQVYFTDSWSAYTFTKQQNN